MFSWIWENIIQKLLSVWNSLPEETKDKIIDTIVEGFEEFLRSFFKENKNKEGN